MKAIAIQEYGGIDKLRLLDVPVPEVGPDEVLVQIVAAGVNPVDGMFREGFRAEKAPDPLVIMGSDFAGRVAKVGAAVREFAAGDEVYGYKLLGNGTYAEYVSVPASYLAKKPSSIGFAEAAVIPCCGLTAYVALRDALEIERGETVLVTGAAGGIGLFAVQIGAALGAHVIGTASARNVDFVRNLGARHVIDYTAGDYADAARKLYPHGVDAALATFGGDSKRRAPAAIRDGGRLVWLSGEDQPGPPMERKIRGTYIYGPPDGKILSELARMVDAGTLRVVIEQRYSLERAAEAQARIASGRVRGKLVIEIG